MTRGILVIKIFGDLEKIEMNFKMLISKLHSQAKGPSRSFSLHGKTVHSKNIRIHRSDQQEEYSPLLLRQGK
jgi:hypothetical protein